MSDNDRAGSGNAEVWRGRLDAERHRLTELAYQLDEEVSAAQNARELDNELAVVDRQSADDASSVREAEMDRSLLTQVSSELEEVNAAIERVAAGTYGICETCDGPIGDERLEALPATRHCVADEPV